MNRDSMERYVSDRAPMLSDLPRKFASTWVLNDWVNGRRAAIVSLMWDDALSVYNQ